MLVVPHCCAASMHGTAQAPTYCVVLHAVEMELYDVTYAWQGRTWKGG